MREFVWQDWTTPPAALLSVNVGLETTTLVGSGLSTLIRRGAEIFRLLQTLQLQVFYCFSGTRLGAQHEVLCGFLLPTK